MTSAPGADAVLVIGAPGSGKSAALEALSDLLADDNVEHSALELEQLARGHPWLSIDGTLPQLAAVVAQQRAIGRGLFLVAATPETDGELDALIDAIRARRVLVACLRARAETVAARVLEREPLHWSGRQGLALRARSLAATVPTLRRVNVLFDTDESEAIDVARSLHSEMEARGLIAPRIG